MHFKAKNIIIFVMYFMYIKKKFYIPIFSFTSFYKNHGD